MTPFFIAAYAMPEREGGTSRHEVDRSDALAINIAMQSVDRALKFGDNRGLRCEKLKILPNGGIASGLRCGRRAQD